MGIPLLQGKFFIIGWDGTKGAGQVGNYPVRRQLHITVNCRSRAVGEVLQKNFLELPSSKPLERDISGKKKVRVFYQPQLQG